jgi:hypothetical protein
MLLVGVVLAVGTSMWREDLSWDYVEETYSMFLVGVGLSVGMWADVMPVEASTKFLTMYGIWWRLPKEEH